MNRRISRPYIPEATPAPAPVTRCKRSCCWSPYGHIPRPNCTCHTAPKEEA